MPLMRLLAVVLVPAIAALAGCGADADAPGPRDPDTAPRVTVDRFAGELPTLLRRDQVPGLPGPDAPIDLDQPPFLIRGFGPGGERVVHYHLDVHPRSPIPIYVLHHTGAATPVPGQLPIVDYVPGDHGYSDFWRVVRVDVPADYVANTATRGADIGLAGWPTQPTDVIVNCPVVPAGSTASRRRGGEDPGLHRGWYEDQIFFYFTFEEVRLTAVAQQVPAAPLYATFNINPPAAGGGWPSGLMTEAGSAQTHTVAGALTGADGYSPLWAVQIYDNAQFAAVSDLASAQAATVIAADALLWNAPLVEISALP